MDAAETQSPRKLLNTDDMFSDPDWLVEIKNSARAELTIDDSGLTTTSLIFSVIPELKLAKTPKIWKQKKRVSPLFFSNQGESHPGYVLNKLTLNAVLVLSAEGLTTA